MSACSYKRYNSETIKQLSNLLINKKYIFVIGPTGVGKTSLIENLKHLPQFKDYKIELLSNFLEKEKTNLTDGPKFIELQKGKDIEEYLKKSIDIDEEIWAFMRDGAVVAIFPNGFIKNEIEENFVLNKIKDIDVKMYILTNPANVRFGFFGYAEAFRRNLMKKLSQNNKGDKMQGRTLDVKNTEDVKRKVSDVKVTGNPDVWQLIAKASSESEGWMKSTKAMDIGNGCLVQTTTLERNPDGSKVIFEAVTFVPNVEVKTNEKGNKYLYTKEV